MSNVIIDNEKIVFSELQSAFYKMLNQLNKKKKLDKTVLEKIILINEKIRLLELDFYNLRIALIDNNNLDNKDELESYYKDKEAIDTFKSLIFYKRLMLN